MADGKIDKLIINSPYEEPKRHWKYNRDTRSFELIDGRRSAGYLVASETSRAFDDPGRFVEIQLVNKIRLRVKTWREAGYPGVTGITRRLLEHWNDPEQREYPFFFCQLEAIETLIWLVEAAPAEKVGINIPSDGGAFERLCSKMATGSGKTIVMAMVIAWQVLNKVTYPQDPKFSKYFLVVAPGLTIKSRLQVLIPPSPGNYFDEFGVVPPGLTDKLYQGRVLVINWHALNWENEKQLAKKKSVDKRGAKSDEAYVREALGEMSSAKSIVVINDEAHHAWRVPAESKVAGLSKEDIEEATIWISGLDRIHRARNILRCFDFSATPFTPTGKKSTEEALFDWITSDFGLNDAIESGLVKTPRVVIRDDGTLGKDYTSKFYHIYDDPDVKDDINRKASETEPLPDLVQNAYYLLGKDWLETKELWRNSGQITPPVMITVANRTETAARVKYTFDHGKIKIEELCDPERTLHIDTKVLKEAETQDEPPVEVEEEDEEGESRKLTKVERAEQLRRTVDTVGQVGKSGEQVQNVISVGMLSEGWDAKTVTHVMGLRAFSSQLLCEQVVGRGLRRTSYEVNEETGLYEPEYVNIFGVPFTFLPHESEDGLPPPPARPKTRIEHDPQKKQYELSWPNVVRIDHVSRQVLTLNLNKVEPLILDANETAMRAELAPVVDGKPDWSKVSAIDLEALGKKYRMQRIVFETSRDVYDQMKPSWKGNKESLLAQLIALVEKFLASDKLEIMPPLFVQEDMVRRVIITLNMTKIVQHFWEAIRAENAEALVPVYDRDHPIRATGDMRPWYTGKPCGPTEKSHINFCVYDSGWEATEAYKLDHNDGVDAWAKNDHLGFEVLYIYRGVVHKYRPDFIVRLTNGTHLVLEVKGVESEQDKTKRRFLDEWIRAINGQGGFGKWACDVSRHASDIEGILARASTN
jgi:type III restriction enzyme